MRKGRQIRLALAFLLLTTTASVRLAEAGNSGDRYRGRMLEILNEVSDLVRRNYYDPNLKNIDWKASIEVARERIRKADHEGEMAAAISGLLVRLNDSHTYFLRPWRLQPVIFGFNAKAYGDDVRIYRIMRNGPAEEAHLQLGDKIVAVEEFAATRKFFDDEVRYFEYLDPRLTLKLKVLRDGKVVEVVIIGKQPATSSRDFVKLYEDYKKEQVHEDEEGSTEIQDGGIAYLRFPSFMASPTRAQSLIKKAEMASVLILDLRDNSGGREDTMKEMASHFLQRETDLVTGISRNKSETIVIKPRKPNLTAPIFVLVDSHSASAAEVLSRVLQLRRRATIIGDVTSGKVNRAQLFGGVGGAVYSIPFGVVITVSKAVMPDGGILEDHGVVPDILCLPSEEDLRLSRDSCLQKTLDLAREHRSSGAE